MLAVYFICTTVVLAWLLPSGRSTFLSKLPRLSSDGVLGSSVTRKSRIGRTGSNKIAEMALASPTGGSGTNRDST